MTRRWRIESLSATPAGLHALGIPEAPQRLVRVCEPSSSALVLGSTQPDPPGRGVPVVRRRSGGGAVLVEPGDVLWVDVVVPAADPLWDDDVARSFLWLGATWARALAALGIDADVHDGGLVCTTWARQVCFAGLGSGEVVVAGRKGVGISQRRTRHAALFQCAALLAWRPERLVTLLGLADDALDELRAAAAPVPAPGPALLDSFLRELPS